MRAEPRERARGAAVVAAGTHGDVSAPSRAGLDPRTTRVVAADDPAATPPRRRHLRNFTENVLQNQAFIDEVKAQAAALQYAILDDPFYVLQSEGDFVYQLETHYDWKTLALLPYLAARSAEVVRQLDAIDAGTFARPPETVPDDETCQDWRYNFPSCPMQEGTPESGGAPWNCDMAHTYDGHNCVELAPGRAGKATARALRPPRDPRFGRGVAATRFRALPPADGSAAGRPAPQDFIGYDCCGCLCFDECISEKDRFENSGTTCYVGYDFPASMESLGYTDAVEEKQCDPGYVCSTMTYEAGGHEVVYGSCAGPDPCANGETCAAYQSCTERCCSGNYCNAGLLGVASAGARGAVLTAGLALAWLLCTSIIIF